MPLPLPEASGAIQEKMQSDPRYQELGSNFPKGEALKQTLERVEPYWKSDILPSLKLGGDILVVAHGNSLRALVKLLTNMDEDEITQFEFATGTPLVCELTGEYSIKNMNFLEA